MSALECLPGLAVETVARALLTGRRELPALTELDPELAKPAATFVTLEHEDRLLGCIGTLAPEQPLGLSVAHCALAAAFDDPRLPPLTFDDFPVMSVKVSVLSAPRRRDVRSREHLVAVLDRGTDGVIVERGPRRATFLPAVWESLPDADDFLDGLWAKAGLARRVWDARVRVSTYTTVELIDRGPRHPLDPGCRVD
jgi:uncharacterized protein